MSILRSRSQTNIRNTLNHTASNRTFYINDQLTNSKDVATVFHSPYKDGKKNANFANPTFLSSAIFYSQDEVKKEPAIKHNLVINKNEQSHRQLYNKRMQKADNFTIAVHQAVASDITRSKSRKANDESYPTFAQKSKSRRKDKSDVLTQQLENLLKYRQNDEKRNRTSRVNTQLEYDYHRNFDTPIYIQKNRNEQEERAIYENKKNLKEWMQISTQIKKLKDSTGQESRKIQTRAMDSFLNTQKQAKYIKQLENKKNAGMLANILRQQIKQAQAKKQQQKRQRANFY